MARVPVRPRTLQELQQMVSPVAVPGGQSEAFRHILFDTQTFVAAGSDQLSFFQNVNNDRTLSNMEAQGQLPDPKFFELFYISVDVLLPVADAAVPAAWDDMDTIIVSGRPTLLLTISDKQYGPWPLTYMHRSGGIEGFGYNAAAVAATATEYANNGPADGGFCVDGAIVIPPKVGFSAVVTWGNAAAVAADTLIRLNLDGVMHRRVL